MSWAKIDGGYAFHEKVIEAGNEVAGAHVRMIAWCAEQCTDGKLTRAQAMLIAGRSDVIESMVRVRLLDADGSGFKVHDFDHYNPTGEAARAQKAMYRERAIKAAQARWGKLGADASEHASEDASKHSDASEHASEDAQTMLGECPSPSPSPSPGSPPTSLPTSPVFAGEEPPAPKARMFCTRQEALDAIKEGSEGRFRPCMPSKGGTFKLDKLRKRPDVLDVCRRIGQWLAAGGDGYMAQIDGRNIGRDLDAWVAHSEAWDGRPVVRVANGSGRVIGMAARCGTDVPGDG